MTKPAIIIPTYNESATITVLLDDLIKSLPQAQIIIIDDNSPDHTARVAKRHIKTLPQCRIYQRHSKSGRGSAVIYGFKKALKDPTVTHCIEMDADQSHRTKDVKRLIGHANSADLVIASRYLADSKIVGWPPSRHIFSRVANLYASLVLGGPSTDYTNGLRCYSRNALQTIDLMSLQESGYVVLMEMYYRAYKKGLSIAEVPSVFINRTQGKSNTTLKEIKNSLTAPLRIRFRHHTFQV